MFWLANKAFALVVLVVLSGMTWAAVIGQPGLSILFGLIGLAAVVLFNEWRHAI